MLKACNVKAGQITVSLVLSHEATYCLAY